MSMDCVDVAGIAGVNYGITKQAAVLRARANTAAIATANMAISSPSADNVRVSGAMRD